VGREVPCLVPLNLVERPAARPSSPVARRKRGENSGFQSCADRAGLLVAHHGWSQHATLTLRPRVPNHLQRLRLRGQRGPTGVDLCRNQNGHVRLEDLELPHRPRDRCQETRCNASVHSRPSAGYRSVRHRQPSRMGDGSLDELPSNPTGPSRHRHIPQLPDEALAGQHAARCDWQY
jgi:hypothetical protein